MNGTEIATVQNIEQAVVPIPSVIEQVAYIQKVMKSVMKDGTHYMVIPGTSGKPSLLKAGAQKLCVSFRLDPEYEVLERIVKDDFVLVEIKCTLYHIPTGLRIASGLGSANSKEDKWRWRNVETDEPVPKEYWAARTKGDQERMRELLGADGTTKKVGGQWVIARRMENDNPISLHNTIFKIGAKRALNDAVLNATAASDIFTQDLEDMKDILPEAEPEPAPEKKPAAKKPAAKRTMATSTTKGGASITDYDMAVDLFKKIDYTKEAVANFIENIDIPIPDGCESPLYDIVDGQQMKFIIDELKGMILDAKNYEEIHGEDGAPLPLDG